MVNPLLLFTVRLYYLMLPALFKYGERKLQNTEWSYTSAGLKVIQRVEKNTSKVALMLLLIFNPGEPEWQNINPNRRNASNRLFHFVQKIFFTGRLQEHFRKKNTGISEVISRRGK